MHGHSQRDEVPFYEEICSSRSGSQKLHVIRYLHKPYIANCYILQYRPVARRGAVGADAPPSQIKGPFFLGKGPYTYLKEKVHYFTIKSPLLLGSLSTL